jgi:phosphotransacetylase
VQRIVGASQLFVGGLGRFMGLHQVEQAALQQAIADHGPALRALGVTFAHGVPKETRMRDVGSLHVNSPEGRLSHAMVDRFQPFVDSARAAGALRMAVAHPCSAEAIQAVCEAREAGLIDPVLVGPRARIEAAAKLAGVPTDGLLLHDVPHSHAAAEAAVALVRAGQADLLMKGSLHTDELLRAVLDRAQGLRTDRRLSHVFVIDAADVPRLMLVTDGAINIAPDLLVKRDICQNAIDLAHALGVTEPRVALLCAVETVNPAMPATLDAAALCKMADRGQITGALLEGPLALDNAVSEAAARLKGIRSAVAGRADILVVPDIEAGNILAKQWSFIGHAQVAGVVLGARVPIVLTSRADSVAARLASCAVAACMARALQARPPKGAA